MKYNLRTIMLRAWKNYRKHTELSFAECLHRAWITAKAEELNAKRIERAKTAAGIIEETNTWSGWKKLGYEVIHGSKALFGTELIWGSKGDGPYIKHGSLDGPRCRRSQQHKENALASAAILTGASIAGAIPNSTDIV